MNWRLASWALAFALLGLQPLWHMLIYPGEIMPTALTTAVLAAPALVTLALTLHGARGSLLTASLLSLLYFCHAIAEWMAVPAQWPMAVSELVLSTGLFSALWCRLRYGDPKADAAP